ncbi:MAG: IclR family transcriptional regulator [Pseudomonadota bacterium]
MNEQSKQFRVDSTLSKGLTILEALAASRRGFGVTELSKELGLTKSNTFRLLQTLTALGYVNHREDKTYAATLRMWQVGRTTVDNLNLREFAAEEMCHLNHETQETVYLAVRDGLNVIYIDKIESQKPIRTWSPIGGSAPIHTVATAKAILAANYDELRAKLSEPLAKHTERTLTTLAELDKDVEETLARGYALDVGGFRDRAISFGAAIMVGDEAVGAIGLSLPDVNLEKGSEDRLGALVQHAATAVSRKLNLV